MQADAQTLIIERLCFQKSKIIRKHKKSSQRKSSFIRSTTFRKAQSRGKLNTSQVLLLLPIFGKWRKSLKNQTSDVIKMSYYPSLFWGVSFPLPLSSPSFLWRHIDRLSPFSIFVQNKYNVGHSHPQRLKEILLDLKYYFKFYDSY